MTTGGNRRGRKPKPMIKNRAGKLVRNERALAGRGLRQYGNPELIQYALEAWADDVASGEPQGRRYTRVRDAIMAKFNCAHDLAEDAIRGMRAYNADIFAAEVPFLLSEVSERLTRIADNNETALPAVSVAALRELGKLNGLYAAQKVEFVPPQPFELHDLVRVLDADGRRALDVVIAQYQAAHASGHPALAEVVEDAEIVGDESN